MAVPKLTAPLRVRFCCATPKVSCVLAVTGLATVRVPPMTPPARIFAPSVMTSVPKPRGLAVMVAPTVLGVLSAPMIKDPAWRLMAVEPTAPKVLAPLRVTLPVPARLRTLVAPAPEMTAGTRRLLGDSPPVVMVRVAPPRATVPPMIGV